MKDESFNAPHASPCRSGLLGNHNCYTCMWASRAFSADEQLKLKSWNVATVIYTLLHLHLVPPHNFSIGASLFKELETVNWRKTSRKSGWRTYKTFYWNVWAVGVGEKHATCQTILRIAISCFDLEDIAKSRHFCSLKYLGWTSLHVWCLYVHDIQIFAFTHWKILPE